MITPITTKKTLPKTGFDKLFGSTTNIATPKAQFVNSLASTPVRNSTPATTPVAPVATSKQVTSNSGATSPTPVAIVPPTSTSPKATYMSSITNTPTPNMPQAQPVTANSTAKDNYITAYKSYVDAQKENKQVDEARKTYNDFVANQAKSTAGLEGQGRGIPLSIVRGQQEKLLRQTQPEAQRLQNEIGIAQDSQKATVDSLKAGVDMYGKLLEQDKPIEVGGVLYQAQPDGSYKALTSSAKTAEGFTLGKGESRYDAQGNLIAGGGGGSMGGGDYTAGANPVVDSYVKFVQGGGDISKVPEEYRDSVVVAMGSTTKPQSEISKQVVSVIDELLLNPTALDSIAGPIDQFIGGLVSPEGILAKNKYNQLKGLLSLDNIKYLKGTGAISDAEQKMLASAASAIGRNLYGEQLSNELLKLKNNLATISDNTITPDEEESLRSLGYTQADIDALKASFKPVGNTTASIPKTSRLASVNNNPGNLRFAGQPGAVQGEGGFARFPSVEAGVQALENQIKLDASRGLTLAQFISKYAPPNENDTNKYIKDVTSMTGHSALTPIASIDLRSLARAIAKKESGTKIT